MEYRDHGSPSVGRKRKRSQIAAERMIHGSIKWVSVYTAKVQLTPSKSLQHIPAAKTPPMLPALTHVTSTGPAVEHDSAIKS